MTSNELLYVKTVADQKSITKAAKELHIAQPSLTQTIQRIEHELGCPLFVRTPSGTFLTEIGEKYYKVADEILGLYDAFLQDVKSCSGNMERRLSVGASWYISTYFLPNIITQYCQMHPNVDIRLTEKNSSELEVLFRQNQLDVIFIHQSPFEIPLHMKTMTAHQLKRERFCVVASSSLNLSKYADRATDCDRPILDLKQLANTHLVKFRENQRIRQIMDNVLQKANVEPPALLYTYGFQNALELASNGNAVTFLPQTFLTKHMLSQYDVDVFEIDEKYDAYWTIYMCYWNQAASDEAIINFVNMGKELFPSK